MLLHITVVVLFGTSHGGGAGRGETALDVLDVTLRRFAAPNVGLRSGPGAESNAGQDLLPRADERRPSPVPPRVESAPPAEPPPTIPEPIAAPPSPAPSVESPPEAAPPPALEPLPRVDLRAPQEVDKPLAPPLIVPPAIERLEAPSGSPALAAPVELVPPPARSLAPAAPIERLAAPAAQRQLAPPVEVPPPVAPARPEAPIERLAAPPAPAELTAPPELVSPVAPVVPAPLERLTAPRIEPRLVPTPSLNVPSPSPAPNPAPSDRGTQPIESAPPAAARPPPATNSEGRAPSAVPDLRAAPAGGAELPRLRLGTPPGDDDIFKPRREVVAPSGEGGAPAVDLDAARQRAREIARESAGTRGILPALPPPPERKSKESLALEKAIKPDCRTAYAGMGLLAVPALVVSTIGDGGCRW